MARDTVALVKDRLSIQDIVAPYVKLRRAGRSLVGLCPFHKEKTGSFHVSLERGTWHCFGCGLGGDGFSFIEKIEGLDFKGALTLLADKAGVPVEFGASDGASKSKKDRLLALMSAAHEFYMKKLSGSPAETYAHSRGLTPETVVAWGLGYAPDAWRELLEALSGQGFALPELLSAGLIKEAEGKPGTYYDRFRHRLMFPIRSVAGKVVAFTGRALSRDEQAKYLNSPETDLYHKSDILYGLDRAKDHIRTRGFALLVEGQLDLIHAHQSGFTNAVALSGTALTEEHIRLIKRFTDNLMLVLDADPAGLTATARSAGLALRQGLRVKAASLPPGKDPADVITGEDGAADFAKRIATAKPVVEFFLLELSAREKDSHRLLRHVEAVVLPLMRAIASPIERDHFVTLTARTLGVSSEAVRESLGREPREESREPATPLNRTQSPETRSWRERRDEELRALVHAYSGTDLAKRVAAEYRRIIEAPVPQEAPSESVLFKIEEQMGETPDEHAADELLHAFELAVVEEAHQEAIRTLRIAESQGDPARIEGAERQCVALQARLASLKTHHG